MTDEERKKLVLRLHQARMASHNFPTLQDLCEEAADEIERLQRELDMTLNLLYQESDRRAKAEHELDLWKKQG